MQGTQIKQTNIAKVLAMVGVLWTITTGYAAEASPKVAAPADVEVPGLPRILIIGDSISKGYAPFVKEALKGKANVVVAPGGDGSTVTGLRYLSYWLGKKQWDVIQFNFGINDVPNGRQPISIEQYEENLSQIVKSLKTTGSRLIWCSTTPIPEGAIGRKPGDEIRYNQAATKIMVAEGIDVNDLHTFVGTPEHRAAMGGLNKDIHYRPDGYKALAGKVVQAIERALQTPVSPTVLTHREPKVTAASTPEPEVPGLPRVLIIGDSISMGYTPFVKEALTGKANVIHAPGNNECTASGLKYLEYWLGKKPWDVIQFNFGLHDVKYVPLQEKPSGLSKDQKWDPLFDPEKHSIDVSKGRQNVPLEQYEKNLAEIVHRLKKTGAHLVFCTTTPVPEGTKTRVAGDHVSYNAAALKIMQAEGVQVTDLCAFIGDPDHRKAMGGLDKDVHYKPEAYKAIAGEVAKGIEQALQQPERIQ